MKYLANCPPSGDVGIFRFELDCTSCIHISRTWRAALLQWRPAQPAVQQQAPRHQQQRPVDHYYYYCVHMYCGVHVYSNTLALSVKEGK